MASTTWLSVTLHARRVRSMVLGPTTNLHESYKSKAIAMAASSPKDRLKQRLALRVAEENRLCEPLQPAAAAVSSTFSCDLSETKFIYVLRHADSFTTGVKRPAAINCKTKRYMWRCAFLCNHQKDGVNSSLENYRSWANWSAGYKPADQKENEADSQPAQSASR